MKNIHILPTDKPSRVYKNLLTDKLFILENSFMDVSECNREYQNIYITNSEEIKEGDWVTNGLTIMKANLDGQPTMDDYHPWRKIIVTTDQDLIKDNVQAIDDEFLEFIVKNPSCERVEVRQIEDELISPKNLKIRFNALQDPPSFISANSLNDMILTYKYKIIIQKEKPKQELPKTEIDWSRFPKSTQEQVGFTEPNIIDDWLDKNGNLEIAKKVEEKAEELCKQETLEHNSKFIVFLQDSEDWVQHSVPLDSFDKADNFCQQFRDRKISYLICKTLKQGYNGK